MGRQFGGAWRGPPVGPLSRPTLPFAPSPVRTYRLDEDDMRQTRVRQADAIILYGAPRRSQIERRRSVFAIGPSWSNAMYARAVGS